MVPTLAVPPIAAAPPVAPGAWTWVAFCAGVVALVFVDDRLARRAGRGTAEGAVRRRVATWVGLGLAFSLVVLAWRGPSAAQAYLAAYLLEHALAVDNVLLWSLLLSSFAVATERRRRRVLAWGALLAMGVRLVLVVVGVALLDLLPWVRLVLAAYLVLTAVVLARSGELVFDPDRHRVVRMVRARLPQIAGRGDHLLIRVERGLRATPLMVALVAIELVDGLFAVDAVTASLAVTTDGFVVFSATTLGALATRHLAGPILRLRSRLGGRERAQAAVLTGLAVIFVVEWTGVAVPPWIPLALVAGAVAVVLWASRDRLRPRSADRTPDAPPGARGGDSDDPASNAGA